MATRFFMQGRYEKPTSPAKKARKGKEELAFLVARYTECEKKESVAKCPREDEDKKGKRVREPEKGTHQSRGEKDFGRSTELQGNISAAHQVRTKRKKEKKLCQSTEGSDGDESIPGNQKSVRKRRESCNGKRVPHAEILPSGGEQK
jgi:hypothetical protein